MRDKPTRRASATDRAVGQTDWERIAALGDAEVAEGVAEDPDAAPLDIDWSSAEAMMPPRKVPVSIRLDTDVLDFFKHEGSGYQSRINAVLRSYMAARIARGSGD
ncbi:BrnA antitoxin family protein [Methylobacterium sp. J-077]|uniref:BrnA antitoxin family protein n=1 Tax=Methylobacterium sp. J-077 TaxID=2836656 RepID=UPI001FBBE1A5|nr:BrnA antitoxin family protein [Methylobacterium sp. J-077]MCJ2126130.1 BrnA antitoxin family protein [Methylobacterium sp. J-077]